MPETENCRAVRGRAGADRTDLGVPVQNEKQGFFSRRGRAFPLQNP